jgi:hypothetical protein
VYLLYIDESGNESDPATGFFVLGGAAVFERVTFFLSRSLEDIQAKHFPGLPPIEFHASPIRTGKGFWRGVPEDKRTELLGDVAEAIATANEPGVALFVLRTSKRAQRFTEKMPYCRRRNRYCLVLIDFSRIEMSEVVFRGRQI